MFKNKKFNTEDLLPAPAPGFGDLRDAYNIISAMFAGAEELDSTTVYILNTISMLAEEERLRFEEDNFKKIN